MQISFGKNKGKTVECLIINDPDYISWLLRADANGEVRKAQLYAGSLMRIFDAKPLRKKCDGCNCSAIATRATFYTGNVHPYWWCDNCDPSDQGANPGNLHVVKTYLDALAYVECFCGGRKRDYRHVVRLFALLKGFPARSSKNSCEIFFSAKSRLE